MKPRPKALLTRQVAQCRIELLPAVSLKVAPVARTFIVFEGLGFRVLKGTLKCSTRAFVGVPFRAMQSRLGVRGPNLGV